MSNAKVTKSALSQHETVETNLRYIDSLAWLMVAASSNLEDDTQAISDTMQVISRLAKEAYQASETARKGGKS